jgi:pimeloyl-ACP methyl ester carboxylesterase
MDALGIERATAIGHSAGGVVTAFLAADNPDRIERAVFIGHGIAMDPMQIIPFVPGLGELAMGRTELFSTVFSEAHRKRLEAAYRIRGTRAALLVFIRRQYTIDGVRLLFGTYEDIAVPVLQVHGGKDESIPVDAARGLTPRLRDARFVLVAEASHDVHIDAPDRLVAEIESFLSGERDPGGKQLRPQGGPEPSRFGEDAEVAGQR